FLALPRPSPPSPLVPYTTLFRSRRAARSGYPVLHEGEEIGHVTSGMLSPTLGYPIALTRLTRPLPEGTEVQVDIRGTATPMSVTPVPFYRRPKPSNARN